MRTPLRDLPGRLTTGAYVLHAGWEKWHSPPERAVLVHQAAAGAFPFLRHIPPGAFVRMLAVSEIGLGALLLNPLVPCPVAGAPLVAFSGGLMAMYLRTPSMHKPGSVWPTAAGTGVSKDVWMFGIGLGLVLDAIPDVD
jgi:uncharacterized membrane protein YphA (DoxX/SURF4 family)